MSILKTQLSAMVGRIKTACTSGKLVDWVNSKHVYDFQTYDDPQNQQASIIVFIESVDDNVLDSGSFEMDSYINYLFVCEIPKTKNYVEFYDRLMASLYNEYGVLIDSTRVEDNQSSGRFLGMRNTNEMTIIEARVRINTGTFAPNERGIS